VGSDHGLRSVYLNVTRCTADEAAQQAVDQVPGKYGAAADMARWTFSVWGIDAPREVERLAYRVDEHGLAVRF
jgi:hypothetical protein